jgi:mono/diheme cytochrome c family protein
MEETLFYVLGITLVVCAVTLTAVGLRSERFPASRGLLGVILGGFAALVVATAAFAWMNAEEEQDKHAAEHAEERAAAAEETKAAETEELAVDEGEEPGAGTAAVEGPEIFDSSGCGDCHTLADAGSSGTVGPDLDGALQGKPASFIEESIVDPNKDIAKGYPPDVMPQTFGESLSPEELDALVKYLSESTS